MNPMRDPVDIAEGKEFLSQLSDTYIAVIKSARLEKTPGMEVACTFEIPGVGKRTTSASSSVEAIRFALIELASIFPMDSQSDSALPMNASSPEGIGSPLGMTSERFRSKTRQLTVGVTMPTSLKERLISCADSQRTSFAEVSRRFTIFGFDDFINKSLFVSSASLFDLLGNELRRWKSSDSEQVMLRLDPGHAVRIRSAAKEYKKSVSELGALCIAHGLVLQEQLVSLESRVKDYKGAAIRPLLTQVGLDSYAASLLSGVLAGTVRAPKALLKRLANVFEAPETLLTLLFKRSFEHRMVPSFKAENGKPEISKTATPWDKAVRSLNLSPDQTRALLDLGA